jgi:cytosine/adenosine deaminase-related metal-dependent hydrolase
MQTFDLTPPEIIRAARAMTMAPGEGLLFDAALLVDNGVVFDVGPFAEIRAAHPGVAVTDLGEATLVPGLVNAHCHLEMCHLAGKIPPGLGFPGWIRALIGQEMYDLDEEEIRAALEGMKRGGVCCVGDIATRNAEAVAGILDGSGFFFVVFQEHIFFAEPQEGREWVPDALFESGELSAAGHALYSTHPRTLRLAKEQTLEMGLPFSIHLAEHEAECAMLRGEENAFLDLLREANIPLDNFRAPGQTPTAYARSLGLLDESTLAVHCVHLTPEDVALLAGSGASACLCPRSNEYIGVGRAPWEALAAAGVNCCLGTDSLASNTDLDLWNEVRFLKERWRGALALEQAVAMVTTNPARALGLSCLGELSPGRAARWAVVPADVEDMFDHA